ncbi:hypothetical protein MPSEU_000486400 [Mayamaea pseudoterrestris]|nr:hypothetical protein MPSEU_000486400 [Mayamaea pseudoterrestris]
MQTFAILFSLILLPLACALQISVAQKINSASPPLSINDGRRQMLTNIVAGSLALAGVTSYRTTAMALDMDAFVNGELASDTTNCDPKRDPKCIPKLNADEALCKYGQSGQARADACKRVKSQGVAGKTK